MTAPAARKKWTWRSARPRPTAPASPCPLPPLLPWPLPTWFTILSAMRSGRWTRTAMSPRCLMTPTTSAPAGACTRVQIPLRLRFAPSPGSTSPAVRSRSTSIPYVDPKRIYLGGHSTGGTLALLVAESSDQFRAIYSLGPRSDMDDYAPKDVPFDTSDEREKRLRSPKLWLDSIHVPTFVFEGTEAPSNIFALREMEALNHNPLVKFVEVPGGT